MIISVVFYFFSDESLNLRCFQETKEVNQPWKSHTKEEKKEKKKETSMCYVVHAIVFVAATHSCLHSWIVGANSSILVCISSMWWLLCVLKRFSLEHPSYRSFYTLQCGLWCWWSMMKQGQIASRVKNYKYCDIWNINLIDVSYNDYDTLISS